MAELTFKSAGVSTREIDLSGPTAVKPQGIPAGVVGTSQKGPAFVPVTVATYQDFVAEFGGTDGKKFAPLAMNEWMKNARAGTFVRVLGAGNAKKRGTDGEVTNAGFVVGSSLPQATDDPSGPGILGNNPYAGVNGGDVVWSAGVEQPQCPGRTYFLGALMREAYGDEGGVAATATLTFVTPLTVADFAAGTGEGVKLTDSAGLDHYLWLHEGPDDRTTHGNVAGANDLAAYEDASNTMVSVGNRGVATLTIADVAALEGTYIELTDQGGDKFLAKFESGVGTSAMADASTPGQVNTVSGTPAGIAAELRTCILDSVTAVPAIGIEVGADPGDGTLPLTLTEFGNNDDEPDGGALISGGVTVVAPDGSTNIGGGLELDETALAAAIVTATARSGVTADLVFTSDAGVLTVTQGTTGIDGNDVADGDAGNASITWDWAIDEATIAVGALPGVGETTSITIEDHAGTTHVINLTTDRTSAISVSAGVASQIGTAPSVAATDIITFDNPAAEWHAGDSVQIQTVDATGALSQTATISFVEDGGAGADYTAGAGQDVTVDLDHATLTALATPAAKLADALDQCIGLSLTVAHDGGDPLTITQTETVLSAVSPRVVLNPGNVEINGTDDATVDSSEDGHTQTTSPALAGELAAAIGLLDVTVTDDGAAGLHVVQKTAGAVTIQNANTTSFVVVTEDQNPSAEARAGAAGAEPGGGGSVPTNITPVDFTGGGDTGEDPTPEHGAWADAGIDTSVTGPLGGAWPIIRAVMYAPQGVRPSLVGAQADTAGGSDLRAVQTPTATVTQNDFANVAAATGPAGARFGSVVVDGTQERFTLLLNGHTATPEYPNILTASMDPQAPDYFMNVFNHDAACIEKAGHYVHTHYNVYQSYATVDAEGLGPVAAAAPDGRNMLEAAFLLHGVTDVHRDAQVLEAGVQADVVDYESHEDRYRTARSPWVISQLFGGKPKNLFRLHALDDGVAGSGKFKLSIEGVMMDSSAGYGTFDLLVRAIDDDDTNVVAYEKFFGLDLNPSSERYIARVIGDQHAWYDFDKREGSQKLVIDGIHPNRSKYIRVEMDPEVNAGTVAAEALPMGYRGYWHLWTDAHATAAASEAGVVSALLENVAYDSLPQVAGVSPLCRAKVPPVPMRRHLAQGTLAKRRPDSGLYWGTMFQVDDDQDEPNKNLKFNASILSYGKYFPMYHSSSLNPWIGDNEGATDLYGSVLDADRFNNNMFSLERVQVVTKYPLTPSSKNPSVYGKVDGKQWAVAEYRRDGVLSAGIKTLEGLNIFDGSVDTAHADVLDSGDATVGSRFLDPKTDLIDPAIRRFAKFSFFMQGGFDGTSIFRKEKDQLLNEAANWEMGDVAGQGGTSGNTVAAYRKAIDVMAEKADVDIKLLAIPGLRVEAVTDYAIDAVESRFDAMYIMDVEERSVSNELMLDYSTQKPGVNLTVENFSGRNIDSSFAAAYFPDVVITDPATQSNVQCPPSVAVLGAFSLNDSVAHPWFAPAGFTRGALKSVVETQVKLSRVNLDTLYESDMNPLAAFPHTPGVVVWGQKTLQQAKSALDRVNVRRLLIEIRREVRRVGNNLLFEPNRAETLGRFSASVNPILQRIQAQQGLDKFKVIIDTTTTTQADIENNTVRGKIFLQPTRTVEFISLDFVVTNAGMEV